MTKIKEKSEYKKQHRHQHQQQVDHNILEQHRQQ